MKRAEAVGALCRALDERASRRAAHFGFCVASGALLQYHWIIQMESDLNSSFGRMRGVAVGVQPLLKGG